jgi:hypothetical protein
MPEPGMRPAQGVVVGVKVNFVLNAASGLRRVIFGLEKDTQGQLVKWIINFQLFERASATVDYGDALVTVNVEVDVQLNQQAATAAQNGLTPGQTAHALGPAAEDAKAAKAGQLDQSDANSTIQGTLTKS